MLWQYIAETAAAIATRTPYDVLEECKISLNDPAYLQPAEAIGLWSAHAQARPANHDSQTQTANWVLSRQKKTMVRKKRRGTKSTRHWEVVEAGEAVEAAGAEKMMTVMPMAMTMPIAKLKMMKKLGEASSGKRRPRVSSGCSLRQC